MNGTYFLALLAGALLCSVLFGWRLQRQGLKPHLAAAAMPVSVVVAAIMAKVVYFLAKLPEQLDNYGIAGLLRTRPAEFSFVGGCIGVVLVLILMAKVIGKPVLLVLDAFAPCGALMAAFVRGCESLLDPMSLVGMGDFVANPALQVFPLAVENTMLYSWFYAVFMLETVLAVIVAVVGFLRSWKEQFAPGRVALQTALFLALPQIFCERLLNQCTKWGFVRVEQLLCAVIVFAVILVGCSKARWFLPALLDFVCVAVLIWMEFTLDNKLLFGIELTPMTCYMVQIASLCGMAALAQWAFSRANRA